MNIVELSNMVQAEYPEVDYLALRIRELGKPIQDELEAMTAELAAANKRVIALRKGPYRVTGTSPVAPKYTRVIPVIAQGPELSRKMAIRSRPPRRSLRESGSPRRRRSKAW